MTIGTAVTTMTTMINTYAKSAIESVGAIINRPHRRHYDFAEG